MKKSFLIVVVCILMLIPFASSTCIYYFYGDGCPHCANVAPFLDDIELKYPDVDLQKFETWSNYDNAEIFDNIFDKFGVVRRGVPAIVIGDDYLMGDTPIIDKLEGLIEKNKGTDCPDTASSAQTVSTTEPSTEPATAAEERSNPAIFYILIALTFLVIIYLIRAGFVILGFFIIIEDGLKKP